MDFEKIVLLCKQKGISISKLEEELGFGNCTILKWKSGGKATIDNAKKVADYFGVTIDYIVKKNNQTVGNPLFIPNGMQGSGGSGSEPKKPMGLRELADALKEGRI